MDNAIGAQARTTDVIAAEIVVIRDQTKRLVLAASVEIGRRLCEAKELLHHGEWGRWLEEKVEYSQSTAGNLMRIYREYGDEQVKIGENRSISQTFANLTYSQAVELFALAPDDREAFIESHDMENESIRALKAEIAEYKKQLDAARASEKSAQETADATVEEYASRLDDAEARARELEEQLSTAAQEERARAAAEIERLKTAAEKAKAKAEKIAAERDKAQLRVEGMQQDFDTFADAQEKLTAELERAQAALKKAEAEMEARIEREAGAIGAMRAEQAVEAVKAQAAAEIAELQKRGDPDIAAARVLFDSILEDANRLRGMMLRAEGDKQERLRSILRAISAKIAEGL